MKKKIGVLLSLTVLLMMLLTLSIQPAIAAGEKIELTKTALTIVQNGENYDITYQYTAKNAGTAVPPKSLTDIYVDDTIHGTSIGLKVVDWGTLVLGQGQTTPAKTWTYTTKAADIDVDELGNRSVTNVATVHSHSTTSSLDVYDSDTCTIPLGGVNPLPEFPAGVLFALGLAGIGGFVLVKRRKIFTVK